MYQNFTSKNSNKTSEFIGILSQVKFNTILRNTYLWMMVGLCMTSISSYLVLEVVPKVPALVGLFRPGVFFILFLVQIGLIFFLQSSVRKMKPQAATLSFIFYSLLNGITLTPLIFMYTKASVTLTFFVTAITFGIVSIFAIVTKKDLSHMGSLLFMGVIGLIVATILNMFFRSSMLEMLISYAGVLIFTGLAAYDTQYIKRMAEQFEGSHEDVVQVLSIQGALKLYLDFINMFIYLLRILGNRRN